MLVSVAAFHWWRVLNIDLEMAFNQTGPAHHKMYARPLEDCELCNELWLLLVAGYDLVNAKIPKLQAVSDDAFIEFGLQHLSVIS